MLALRFTYDKNDYSALVRFSDHDTNHKIRVTVRNGEIERRFFGHHIFSWDYKCVNPDHVAPDQDIADIQFAIAQKLTKYLSHTLA